MRTNDFCCLTSPSLGHASAREPHVASDAKEPQFRPLLWRQRPTALEQVARGVVVVIATAQRSPSRASIRTDLWTEGYEPCVEIDFGGLTGYAVPAT